VVLSGTFSQFSNRDTQRLNGQTPAALRDLLVIAHSNAASANNVCSVVARTPEQLV
jgi:hypothetical protein